jgi:hypothetical protein
VIAARTGVFLSGRNNIGSTLSGSWFLSPGF